MILDYWMLRKIGMSGRGPLTRELLEAYQLRKLNETLDYARANSRFYRERLDGLDACETLAELERLPMTTVADLREQGMQMVCVRQDEIVRITTLQTSGTTGKPKRVFFTAEDQELTIDFFHHGMRILVDASDTVLILLPCVRPGSVGELLHRGLLRVGAKSIPYGMLSAGDPAAGLRVVETIRENGVTCVVGGPADVARLASMSAFEDIRRTMRSVLLSTEYVSDDDRNLIEARWDCAVYEHYGMTEMGFGGAVACHCGDGYHMREADLLFEIVDPGTARPLPDGCYGEIAFTTLTRVGMPLIRYRTGDYGCIKPEACACGSSIKKLGKVAGRLPVGALRAP